jgi:F-type H+-transporting ATPase subunit a
VGFLTITNQTLWLAIAVLLATALMVLPMRNATMVPGRFQSVAELIYGFVRKMVIDMLGDEGIKFFPYIFTLFIFILISNVAGLIPASFTTTSHVAVTGVLAMAVFMSVTVIGFMRHGVKFIGLFWVSSAPTVALRLVLFLIELISYFVRPLSHSVRLAGNMMAGHAVLKVFAAFVPAMGLFGFIPLGAMTGIFALELLVACVQAYIFTILTCVYLNDALHMH